jgi:hypothetical protein
VLVELAIDRGKDGFAGIGGDQAFLKDPDRGAIRNLLLSRKPTKC